MVIHHLMKEDTKRKNLVEKEHKSGDESELGSLSYPSGGVYTQFLC